MYKDGVLTIGDWTKGMGDSPLVGFSTVANCEVFDVPGVLRIANRTIDASQGQQVYSGLPVARLKDIYGNVYHLTDDGKFWINYTSFVSLAGTPWDMVIFKDYILITHGTSITAYGPLSDAGKVPFPAWKGGLSGNYYAKLLVEEDIVNGGDAVYICNGNSIAKLSQFVAGATGMAPTAVLDLTTLPLPDGQFAVTMAPLGTNIMIGTQAGSSWFTRNNFKVANIYPWDKVATSYNRPVILNESSVQAMISDNNRLYIVAGTRGNVYQTDSTNYRKVRRIPWTKSRSFGATMQVFPNAIAFNNNANLLIGTTSLSDSYETDNSSLHGVYEIDVTSKFETVFKHQISAGTTGAGTVLKIGCISSEADDSIIIGWQSGNTYGIDTTDFKTYGDYAAHVETPLIFVATRNDRKKFQKIEVALSKPLIQGQSVRVSYRTRLTGVYKLIGEYGFTELGTDSSYTASAPVGDVDLIQVFIEPNQPENSPAGSNVNLINVRLW